MSKALSKLCMSIAALSFSAVAESDLTSKFNEWSIIASKDSVYNHQYSNSRSTVNKILDANIDSLSQTLLNSNQAVVITLPLPNGKFADFKLSPSSVMANSLSNKYPSIKTFSGYQVNYPENSGRFDITPQGFHGLFKLGQETVFIEPQRRDNNSRYVSYYRKHAIPHDLANMPKRHQPKRLADKAHNEHTHQAKSAKAGQIKTYRIAVSAVGEYTQFHGGTKERGLAAVVTMINRVNDVYQQDLGVKLELVANNDALIFVNAETDPFANNDDDGSINTAIIDGAIGSNSYDIGHVVNTRGGGLAAFGVLCNPYYKGDGMTGSGYPTSDAFYIDYVAHEIGHQFGADHTFNGETDACLGNREGNSAYEPGSGSTVMGYAGICGSQNLQDNSNPYFHSHSIDQMEAHIASTSSQCGTTVASNTAAPTVNAGADYTIPAKTPFTLTGSASSTNNAALTYDWQQYDLGPASANATEQVDDGKRPIFRVWSPKTEPSRTFPRLTDILQETLTLGETYPTTNRDLNFRLVVRDNQNNIAYDAMKVTVIDTQESFAITEPSAGSRWSSNKHLVNWNTAKTDEAPIACEKVNIQLSTDGGSTFATDLAMAVANDGSHEVTLEETNTDKARIKVSCANNIFFAINKGDFAITSNTQPQTIIITGVKNALTTDEDKALSLSTTMFNYQGQSATSLNIQSGSNYTVDGMTITPVENYYGNLSVTLTASNGNVTSQPFTATIAVSSVNDAPVAVDDSVQVDQDSANNVIAVLENDSDVDSGDTLTVKSTNYTGNGTVTISGNNLHYSPAAGFSGNETISYTIEDNAKAQATAVVSVSVKAKTNGSTGNSNNTSSSNSSGGSFGWSLLVILAMLGIRIKGSKLYE